MATKRDLVEAHAFSRRRLVTAFVSGAPGGREVEPVRPGRTIVGGVALSVLLVAAAAITGVFSDRPDSDWDAPGLVISKELGAAYVILDEDLADDELPELRPVLNITSAQLILGAEGLELAVAGCDRQQVPHLLGQSGRLGDAHRVDDDRNAVLDREGAGSGEGRHGQVAVQHDHPGPGHDVGGGPHVRGRQRVGGGHVGDARDQLAAVVQQGGVGAGRPGVGADVGHVDPGRGGRVQHQPAQVVVADHADEGDRAAQVCEVLGDVASHPARGERGGAGVGGPGDQRRCRAGLEVGVDAADDHHTGPPHGRPTNGTDAGRRT